jgi:hypothetical protein
MDLNPQGKFMKEVAILLLVALLLNGCSSSSNSTTAAQTAASGVWSADLPGGSGEGSGFSFTTQFTVNSGGTLSITYFQFLTQGTCFPVSGGTQSGTLNLTIDTTTNAVTGTFTYDVKSGNNDLALTGTVTGTESGSKLSGGVVTGTWTLSGDPGCNSTQGSFTMKQIS